MSCQLLMCIYRQILTKSLRQHILLVDKGINFSTKSKTHYDTLKVSPNATHNEIKSAYYKLTIEYHPDKNKSPVAKQMFQEILDAYNVLSNFKLRQQYDRSVAITHRHNIRTASPRQQWQTPYQTTSQLKTIYNFDEWTQQHYKQSFQINLKRQSIYKEFVENQHKYTVQRKESKMLYYSHAIVSLLLCLILYKSYMSSSKNISSNKKNSDSEY